jgi:hypothetical protein
VDGDFPAVGIEGNQLAFDFFVGGGSRADHDQQAGNAGDPLANHGGFLLVHFDVARWGDRKRGTRCKHQLDFTAQRMSTIYRTNPADCLAHQIALNALISAN